MNNLHIKFDDANCFKYGNLVIKFKGLVFYKNYMCGVDSLKHFFYDYSKYIDNVKYLRGNFVLCICDKSSTYVFTDNSGMSRLYYYKDLVFDKYLELIDYFKLSSSDLDSNGVVEYIQYGYSIFFTLFKDVKILGREDMICINGKKLTIQKKLVGDIFDKGEDIVEFYNNFKYNFKDMKIACDLTAGIDSRLNVALLKNSKINFKTSISGQPNHIDVMKCKEISKILNIGVLQFELDKNIDKSITDKLFYQLDGQYSILEFYKNYILTMGLIDKKINLRISGAGGEMYKYSWFAEDFPRFNKKKFTLDKVYKKRFFSRSVKYDFYTDNFVKKIDNYQEEVKDMLEKYRCINNSKTYDKICYETIMRFGASTQMIQFDDNYVRYAPLLELSVVRNGVNLSVKDRLLYMYHRRLITKSCADIANVKTNKGLSVSSSVFSIGMDALKLFGEFIVKIKNKIFRINVNKTDNANSDKIYEFVRKNDADLIKIIKKYDIVDDSFDNTKVDNQTYSRLITIAKMIDYIDNKYEK